MSETLGQYLKDIGRVPLLNAAKERELSRKIEEGRLAEEQLRDEADPIHSDSALKKDLLKTITSGSKARDLFMRANLRLVVSVARRYPLPPGMELGDLIQEGNLGLEHAVTKFDWRKGFKFSTYATFWIRQAIGRALDQRTGIVKLPGDRAASLRAALRAAGGDAGELDEAQAQLHRITNPTSLDRPIGDTDGNEMKDMIPNESYGPEHAIMEKARKQFVTELLHSLDERSQQAVALRFGLLDGQNCSFRDVGEKLNITAEAARRLVKRSLFSLKNTLGDEIPDYLLQAAS